MPIDSLLLTAVGLLLVLLNGFFVAAEFSIVKLRRTRADELARTLACAAECCARYARNLDAYLSACQLGITLASLGLGWIGEPAFAASLEPVLRRAGIDDPTVLRAFRSPSPSRHFVPAHRRR